MTAGVAGWVGWGLAVSWYPVWSRSRMAGRAWRVGVVPFPVTVPRVVSFGAAFDFPRCIPFAAIPGVAGAGGAGVKSACHPGGSVAGAARRARGGLRYPLPGWPLPQ